MEEEQCAQRIFLTKTIENLCLRESKDEKEEEMGHTGLEVFMEVFQIEP
jgi:hypothetical protein